MLLLLPGRVKPFGFASAGTARSLTHAWLVPVSLLQSLLVPLVPVLVCRQKTWAVCVWPVSGVWFGVWHAALQLILEGTALSFPETADGDLQ